MKQFYMDTGFFLKMATCFALKKGIQLPEAYLLNVQKAINIINISKNFYGNDGLF